MLEQKRFGKIAAIPAAVWLNFSEAFIPKRLMQTSRFNFGVRAKTIPNVALCWLVWLALCWIFNSMINVAF
jgi:hypothetical protein